MTIGISQNYDDDDDFDFIDDEFDDDEFDDDDDDYRHDVPGPGERSPSCRRPVGRWVNPVDRF